MRPPPPRLHRAHVLLGSGDNAPGWTSVISFRKTGNIMRDLFSNAQQIRKPAVVSKGGIVAAQSRKAAEIGAEVLAAGGDCVDAVIATTFALGVLEPWMSGVGGGGAMVLYRAR